MNRINRKVEYSLLALKHMSSKRPGELTSAKEICHATGAPFDATSRVMQLMAQKGILKSEHGAQGGYQIIKDLSRVSLYEVIATSVGPLEIVKCVSGAEDCDLFNKCGIQSPLNDLNIRLKGFYEELSIAELLKIDNKTESVEWPNQQKI